MKKIVLLAFVLFCNIMHAQSFLWANTIGSYCGSAATNTAGSIYTTGNFYGLVDFDPGPGTFTLGASGNFNSHLFISKTDFAGNFISAQAIVVAPGQGYILPYSIKTDVPGNVYITGAYLTAAGTIIDFDPGPGTYTLACSQPTGFILKLDASGNFVWAKKLDGSGGVSCGTAIAIDASGNVITAGHYAGTTDFDPGVGGYSLTTLPGAVHGFVLQLDASGNFTWVKEISGATDILINDMTLDVFGSMYFAGQYEGTGDFDPGLGISSLVSAGNLDIFALKLDGSGNFVWAQSMGGAASNFATGIAVDALGNAHLTGAFAGIVDFDPGAGTYTLAAIGSTDAFIMKLDAMGNLNWVKTIGTTTSPLWLRTEGLSIDLDVTGSIYTTGLFCGSTDFDPGAGSYSLTASPTASWSSFITELDPSGNFVWAGTMGGGEGRSVIVNGPNVYAAGIFVSPGDIDPTITTYTLPGFSDGFILKLTGVYSTTIDGLRLFCNNNGSATATYSVLQDPANTYSWIASPGAVINSPANTSSVNVTFASGSTTLAVTVSNFSATSTSSIVVTVDAPPILTITALPSLSVCAGSTLSLGGSGAAQYAWSSGISNNIPFAVVSSGNYTLTGISAGGCTAASTVAVTAYSLPIVYGTATPSSTLCTGSALTLGGIGVGASTYSWSGGVLDNVAFTATSSSVYTVTGTGTNGCMASANVSITVNPLPQVGIAVLPSTLVCAGSTLSLGGTGATSYNWSGGIVNAAPFAASSSTVYTVTGTNTNGCANTASVSITVNGLPSVGIVVLPSATVCAGSTLSLGGTGASIYNWSNGIINTVPFTPASSTVYTLIGSDANGCSNTATISITVNTLPLVGVVVLPSATVCAGSTLNLSGTGASLYSWSSGITDNVSFTASSSAVYTLTGTSVNGCVNTATVSTTINSLPVVGAVISPSTAVCAGSTLNLNGTGASVYSWSGGIANNVPFITTTSAVYTVTGTDANGCVNTSTISATVNPLPVLGVVALPSLSICAGSSLSLSGTGAATYAWSSGVNNGVAFIPGTTASYSLTGTNGNGCTNTLTLTVVVNPQPNTLTQPLSQTVAVGSATQFVVSSSNLSSAFQWQQNTGAGFTNLSNTGSFSGVNTATLVLTNASLPQNNLALRCILSNGMCSDTSDVATLTVYDDTGIGELANEKQFRLSPNPAGERCTIYISQVEIGLIYHLTDQTGRQVRSGNIEDTNTEIDLRLLVPGLYFVWLSNPHQKPVKLVKLD